MTAHERLRLMPNNPDHWLALLRIVVGLWFLKSVRTKLGGFLAFGFVPLPSASERWINFLPKRLLDYAETVRIDWYSDFLVNTAIPNAPLFAQLTAFGEVAIGLGLTLGLATRLTSGVGLTVMANYFIATYWVGYCQQGFHTLLMACMIAFLGARAGRTWGLDGWLKERFPGSFLFRWRLA